MGYEVNSPIKQVWLPFDYDWIRTTLSDDLTFKEFSKLYQEKYGIDLHDLFILDKDRDNQYYVKLKVDLIGGYIVGKMDGSHSIKYANPSIIKGFSYGQQGQEPVYLLEVVIGSEDFNTGVGFRIALPIESVEVSSIDDLKIAFFEI